MKSINAQIPQPPKVSNCATPVLYHRVCEECGHYRGKQVIAAKANS